MLASETSFRLEARSAARPSALSGVPFFASNGNAASLRAHEPPRSCEAIAGGAQPEASLTIPLRPLAGLAMTDCTGCGGHALNPANESVSSDPSAIRPTLLTGVERAT